VPVSVFSYLVAETKDREMSQNCIVNVKFLKDVRDFDRNAADWQQVSYSRQNYRNNL
jgi:hypothetical protein